MGKSRKIKLLKPGRLIRPGITRQLLVWFLIIAFLPLSVVTFIVYSKAQQSLTESAIQDLQAVANRQSRQIIEYVRHLEKDVTTLSRTPDLIESFKKFDQTFASGGLSSVAYQAVNHELRPFLTFLKESFGYSDLFLISPYGTILFSVKQGEELGTNMKSGFLRQTELAKVFDRANTLLETAISDFEYYPVSNAPAAFIASPVRDDRDVIGVVVFQMSNDEIYRIVNDYTGLGRTGETVVASQIGEQAIFQAPTRHDPYAAFRKQIKIDSSRANFVVNAVQGSKGSGISIDYRGVPVLAVWKYMPELRWGMVTKIDIGEAFAPIERLKMLYTVTIFFTLMLVFASALIVANSISRPILKLTNTTKVIAKGYLKHVIRLPLKNEIGELANSFNEMTLRLSESVEQLRKTTAEKERIESELRIAHNIQMGILPKIFPPFPDRNELDIYAKLLPAKEVGGDFYTFFFIDENHLCFSVGDVSGKGVPAALLMAVTSTLIKAKSAAYCSPDKIMSSVNRDVCEKAQSHMFVTAFLGILDVRTGIIEYSNAGHNMPFILRSNNHYESLKNTRTLVLGAIDNFNYEAKSVKLERGDAILLYTDGVTEAENSNKSPFEENRFESVIQSNIHANSQVLTEQIIEALNAFTSGIAQFDDITVMALRWTGKRQQPDFDTYR